MPYSTDRQRVRDLTDASDSEHSSGDAPTFDDWEDPDQLFEGQSIKERMLDVIVQLREPTKVSTVAERADCDTETARDYLQWFEDLRLVREQGGRPARYERNDSFLRWRRVEQIRDRYLESEIVDELGDVMDEIEAYRDQFDAASPDHVSLTEASHELTVEEAWDELSNWQTLERRAELLDAARRDAYAGSGVDQIDA